MSFRCILSVVLFICIPVLSMAAAERDRGTFNIQFENDLYASGGDRHFTNGLRLSYLTPARPCDEGRTCLSGIMRDTAQLIPWFRVGEELRVSYSLGHNIFTPDDITRPDLLEDERPYAGWLYGGIGFVSKDSYPTRPGREYNRIDNFEINLGVVGPMSGAAFVQRNWHKLFGFREPRGWSNQLRNEPGIVLLYERIWQFRGTYGLIPGLELEAAPAVGGALGNVFTYAAGGLRFRIGTNLPEDYGPPRIRPSLPGSDYFAPRESRLGLYLFGSVEGRAVVQNIFLDGNTFRSSHSVDKKLFVGDLLIGAAVVAPRIGVLPPFRLAYSFVVRSREFKSQANSTDRFGSINLSFNMDF